MPSSLICLSGAIRFSLHLIASIPLIQRREKCPSREEKSIFLQWFFRIYARSLKDLVRQSKYPRTQILDPRMQPKHFCHSSTTFIPTRSNNLNIGQPNDLYRFIPLDYRGRVCSDSRLANRPIELAHIQESFYLCFIKEIGGSLANEYATKEYDESNVQQRLVAHSGQ